MDKTTLYIVDDHQLLIDGITSMLASNSEWEVIGYANDGQEAVTKVPILKPDIVLMDLDMPIMNGMIATEKLLKIDSNIKIVIITLHHEKAILKRLIKLGASGYMLKDTPKEEFIKGLELVSSGSNFYSSHLTESILNISSLEVKKETNVKLLCLLSDREREVLALVAEGLSTKEMADKINLSPKTVESYRKNLLQKLEARNTAHLIRIALKEGILDID
jgi:two-component system, NarL family, nitrate/nitrite response regulator NarL